MFDERVRRTSGAASVATGGEKATKAEVNERVEIEARRKKAKWAMKMEVSKA